MSKIVTLYSVTGQRIIEAEVDDSVLKEIVAKIRDGVGTITHHTRPGDESQYWLIAARSVGWIEIEESE